MSLRYESNNQRAKNSSFQKTAQRQRDMVKMNEEKALIEKNFKMDEIMKRCCDWSDSQDEAVEAHKVKENQKTMMGELKIASKALIMVRQAALKKLAMEEYSQYERELQLLGKTFYVERM